MIEAGIAWLALIGFEVVQTLRRKPTLSKFAWTFGRRKSWLLVLGIGLVAFLALHLLLPMLEDDPPPPKGSECMVGVGVETVMTYHQMTLNSQPNGKVTASRPDGQVLSVQPDGKQQWRPPGTAGPFELATVAVDRSG